MKQNECKYGTVALVGGGRSFLEATTKLIEEVETYRAIGTVEEFKDLKERTNPKKVNNLELAVDKYGTCPCCGTSYQLLFDETINYCQECGQHLDWSENK